MLNAARIEPTTTAPCRDHLITENMSMAIKMARKMARRLPLSVCRDDIESAALLGLTEAAHRYDDSRTEPFMAFAVKRVRGAILDHLRKNDLLSRRARQGARRVATVTRELEGELGRKVRDDEVARAMGISEDDFASRYARVREAQVIHLDDLRGEVEAADDSGITVADRERRRTALVRALEKLDRREQMVLACYYKEGLTLREIGAILGVTESRVCQLHTQAIRALRGHLSD